MIKASIDTNKLWTDLPWQSFRKILLNLQRRIYEARKNEDYQSVIKLQRLLIKSKSARFLAIQTISETMLYNTNITENYEDKVLSSKEKFLLVQKLEQIENWNHSSLNRINLLQSNHKKKIIVIPNIEDKIVHLLIKYTLEPCCEAYFSSRSYGFRPYKNIYDAQKDIFHCLSIQNQGYQKKILKLNFEKSLEKVDHNILMSLIILPHSIKQILWKALKLGIEIKPPNSLEETRQGKILAPLLINILLDGIESLGDGVRYLETVIFFIHSRDNGHNLIEKIYNFFKERSLNFKLSTIKLITTLEGFDFIHWHFKVKSNYHSFSVPNKNNLTFIKKRIKKTLRDTRLSIEERLYKIKKIYTNWWKYHKYCDMRLIKASLWGMRKSSYKYIRKATKISPEKSAEYIANIFNGHKYKSHGYFKKIEKQNPYNTQYLNLINIKN